MPEPLKTRGQLIDELTAQLSKIKDNQKTPMWVVKMLNKRLIYLRSGTMVTADQRLADLQEQLADMLADPKTSQTAIVDIQNTIAKFTK